MGVAVTVGVFVITEVAVAVRVWVDVLVLLDVGVRVYVCVRGGVLIPPTIDSAGVYVGVKVAVGPTGVFVLVAVFVGLGPIVFVGVVVGVLVTVLVDVLVRVAVHVGVLVGVNVFVGVEIPPTIASFVVKVGVCADACPPNRAIITIRKNLFIVAIMPVPDTAAYMNRSPADFY